MDAKKVHDVVELSASAAKTVTGNGSSVRLPGMVNGFAFVLDLTAAATDVGDLLDVYVQTKIDGTNWLDVVHFTQCLGNGGTKRYVSKIVAGAACAEFENGSALGAAGKRDLLGDEWRARWTVVDAGTDDASFTFSVTACPM